MEYADFYDIAVYGNANWKGSFTSREIACNAYDYLCEFNVSKVNGEPTHTIKELARLLMEDGSEETKEWFYQIVNELSLTNKKKTIGIKYEVILEKGEYALILRGSRMEEYAVVNGLNKERGDWAWTCCYYNFSEFAPIDKAKALFLALDYFRMRTEDNYIPRCRLEELAIFNSITELEKIPYIANHEVLNWEFCPQKRLDAISWEFVLEVMI